MAYTRSFARRIDSDFPRGFSPFVVRDLFRNGEAGVWHDPSDLTTMYQDSAGTIPVTAAGDPVGLVLDKAKGVSAGDSYGPELVTNGGFDTDVDGWGVGSSATLAWSAGTAIITNPPADGYGYMEQMVATTAGASYAFEVDVIATGGNGVSLKAGTTAGGTDVLNRTPSTTTGRRVVHFVATSTETYILVANHNNGASSTIDNISVREIPGSHLIQDVNDDYRPTLARHPDGGLRNLLPYTEDFSNAAWSKVGCAVADQTNGTVEFTPSLSAELHYVNQPLTLVGGKYTAQVLAKVTGGIDKVTLYAGGSAGFAHFNLDAGTASKESNVDSVSITDVGDGWYLCAAHYGDAITENRLRIYASGGTLGSDAVAGDGSSILLKHPQLEEGTEATAYQKVTTRYDVTEAGKRDLWYLDFDGVDDYMYVPSLDMSASDKVTAWGGVHKSSDVSSATVCELSSNLGTNNGSFLVAAPGNAGLDRYQWGSKGTTQAVINATGFVAPTTNVLTGIGDISGDEATLRVDGAQAATSSGDQGTGNFGTYPLYVGARAGSSLFFNGRIYGLVIRGGASTDAEIAKTERYMARKTGVTL